MGTTASSWAQRISDAELRLGTSLPHDWRTFIPDAPVDWGIEFIMPEDLATLDDPRFDGLLDEAIKGEERARGVPFAGDGAGNFYAFLTGHEDELQVIDLDHEATTSLADAATWPSFGDWRDWAETALAS